MLNTIRSIKVIGEREMRINTDWINDFMERHWRMGDYKVWNDTKRLTYEIIVYLPIINKNMQASILMGRIGVSYEQAKKDNADKMWTMGWRRMIEMTYKKVKVEMGIDDERKTLLGIISRNPPTADVIQDTIYKVMADMSVPAFEELANEFFKFRLSIQ